MMREKVEKVLEEIRPSLQADGGDVELVDVDEEKEDFEAPYNWEWKAFSFGKYILKLIAYYDGKSVEREIDVWKFL